MQSFKTLYREHYGFVWATVRRHGVTPMLVEDAVHDTFVVAYRRLDAFDGTRPKAWLYSIGRRVASSYRRTESRREARHLSAADITMRPRDMERTVGAKTALDRFLDTLSASDRELFVLSEVDGLTGPELAATLGRKLPTLYSRVRVLRQRFERSFDGETKEERPAANARGWMLLQPWLAAPAGVSSVLVTAAVAVGLAGVTAIGVSRASSSTPHTVSSLPLPSVAAASLPPPVPPPAPVEVKPPAPAIAPTPAPMQAAEPRPRPRSAHAAKATPEPVYDLGADTALLREIKAALAGGSAKRAQTLLKEHEASFPNPAQPDVRVALWVETLCALGRTGPATDRANALLKRRPGTPVGARIRATCAGDGLEP